MNYINEETLHSLLMRTAIEELGVSEEAASQFAHITIDRYKAKNPYIHVKEGMSEHNGETAPVLGQLPNREIEKFVAYAKEQGTKIPFDSIETGILAAGRKDMQDGLTDILNSVKFEKPSCQECDEKLDNRGRSKKKILTIVGWIEINPERYTCAIDVGQGTYPLLDFIGLIDNDAKHKDKPVEKQTIKCTREAAASIALACSESPYEQAMLLLNRLAGLDLTIMTEFRVTDSVSSEFVRDVPVEMPTDIIEKMADTPGGNILETRVNQLNGSDERDENIQKAVKDGPDGVFYKDYRGPTIKVMYILPDGTGVPGRHQELAGIKGKQPDGSAKTFEAKIGAVFTIEYTADGKPLLTENGEIYRDKSVSYIGTTRKVEDFGAMLHRHAIENGLENMDAVVFLGDGAKWVWGIRNTYFPYALPGLDLYHSTERVNAMVDLLQFKGRLSSAKKQEFKDRCIELLCCGKVQDMLDLIDAAPLKKGNDKKLESAMGYFHTNMERMNYGVFTACGIFVGSGVIEAGCKVIVGNRMKNAGMHWSKDHAEKMISLRCAVRNGKFFNTYLHERKKTAA